MSDYLTKCNLCDLVYDYRAETHSCSFFVFPDSLDMIEPITFETDEAKAWMQKRREESSDRILRRRKKKSK